MFCMNCGKPIPDGGKFCPFCGTAVPQQFLGGQPAAPAPAPAASAPAAAAPTPAPEPKVHDGEWNEARQAYQFDLDGYTISFGKEHVIYGAVREAFLPLWEAGNDRIEQLYEGAESVEEVLRAYYSVDFLRRVLAEPIQLALDTCADHGEYDITEETVLKTPSLHLAGEDQNVISAWELGIAPLLEKYQAICQAAQNERDRRAYRKETRMRLEGGGFGLTGALTAIAKAGAFNITSGVAHSAFNAVGNAFTGSAEKRRLRELFESRETLQAMRQAYSNAFSTILTFVTQRLGGKEMTKSEKEKAKMILANIESGRITGEAVQEALLEGLTSDPFNEDIYKTYLKYVPNTNGRLDKIAALFHMDGRITGGKDEILQSWIDNMGPLAAERFRALLAVAKGEADERSIEVYLRMDALTCIDADEELLAGWHEKLQTRTSQVLMQLAEEAGEEMAEIKARRDHPVEDGELPFAALAGSDIEEYTVPEGVTDIGDYAFADCAYLEKVTLPRSLRHIGKGAFRGSGLMMDITIPAGVETYDAEAYTTEDGTVHFEGEPKITGNGEAFKESGAVWDIPLWGKLYEWCKENGCLPHTAIFTAEDAKEVLPQKPEDGFYLRDYWNYPPIQVRGPQEMEGDGLPPISILDTNRVCRAIDQEALAGADVVYVVVPDEVETIGSRAFYDSYLTEIDLGSGVKTLEAEALAGCTYLRQVLLPEGLQKVGDRAFADCYFLDHIEALQMHCEIGEDIFRHMSVVVECLPGSDWESWCKAHGVRYFYHGKANPWEELLQHRRKVIEDEGLWTRKKYLKEAAGWREIADPEGKSKGLFGWGSGRKYQFLFQAEANGDEPDLLGEIVLYGDKKFSGKSRDGKRKITVVKTEIDTEMIASGALIGSDLVFVEGDDTEYLGTYALAESKIAAFEGLDLLEIWESAFEGCENLSAVLLGENLERIEDRAFAHCPLLTRLYLPESVKEIGENAFEGTPVTIVCGRGSAAEAYCKAHQIPVEAE